MTEFVQGNGASILSSFLGLAGSLILVWAAGRSLKIRKTALGIEAIRPKDATMVEVVAIVAKDLSAKQIEMIRGERHLYWVGALLLGASFLLSLLADLKLI